MGAQLATMMHRVQEHHPRELLAGTFLNHVLTHEEFGRLKPRIVVKSLKFLDDDAEGVVQLLCGVLDGAEGDLVSVMDDAIVDQLSQIKVVANEVFDQFAGTPGLRIWTVFQAVLQNGLYNLHKEAALLGQETLEEGTCAHERSP
jgi:hypothetical protein